jgi:hypothetical protein
MEKPSTRRIPLVILGITIESRGRADSSITIEDAPIEVPGSVELSASSAAEVATEGLAVKKEGESSKIKPTTSRTNTKIKKEDENAYESFDEADQIAMEQRIDLAELNFPGGPVSSRRKNDRVGRGWKKIELWIEQEDPEEIVLDDDDGTTSTTNNVSTKRAPKQVTVKIEDDVMEDVQTSVPETMVIDDDDHKELLRLAERSRKQRRRKAMKGKSREEKEEIAREEVDLEVLKNQFLNTDASEVCNSKILLTSRERRG